ncbi:MAG: amino acid adenylation [Gammaproteobacteria bacterium]|nr:amino acid adenylation [Gammaproteobacteria bacterium]MBU1553538.1 amino acid adenylation [Gammaproteobacteria bacterium]MBU2071653.1 amino acid adenylation [Gammaproteobacteria bacterium]MBU2204009.1 amino acid adenylation [Gammaproteobacteria bacterium]
MKYLYCTTNALNKWLKTDLPRLPSAPGQQVGVNTVTSTREQMCWQLHIIENRYGSWHKTIIATEANSRFTLFIPVDLLMSVEELTQRLQMEWQWVLAETLRLSGIMPRSDIALLLSSLGEVTFEQQWVKNTDRSVNGHVSDAGLWATQTLADRRKDALSPDLALELAVYLNTQPKRVNKAKSKVVPVLALLDYCTSLIKPPSSELDITAGPTNQKNSECNVVYFKDFKK